MVPPSYSFNRYRQEAQYLADNQLLIPNVAFSPENYLQITEKTGLVFFIFSEKTDKLVYISPGYAAIWGKNPKHLYKFPNSWIFQIHSDDYYQATNTIKTRWRSPYEFEEKFRIVRSDTSVCPIKVNVFPIFDRAQCISYYFALVEDCSDLYQLKQRYRADLDRYAYFFNKSPLPLSITSGSGHFKFVNEALCSLLGYDKHHLLHLSWGDITDDYDRDYAQLVNPLVKGERDLIKTVKICRTRNNELVELTFEISFSGSEEEPLFNNQITHYDDEITLGTRKPAPVPDRIKDLPDRKLFAALLEREIEFVQKGRSTFCLLLLDFKHLDSIRHSGNEKLYCHILGNLIYRIEFTLSDWDHTIGHIQYDSFGLILRKISSSIDSLEVRTLVQKLRKALDESIVVEGRELSVQTAVAIVPYIKSYNRGKQLIQDGELTLAYLHQHAEKFMLFTPQIRSSARLKLELASALPKAIRERQFLVYYQPIVSLTTGYLYGFEALVRWQHGETLVSPSQFIPICEETGLIIQLGMDLLRSACKTVRQWQLKFPHYSQLIISVNLSAKQFQHPTLVEDIQNILDETGLDGSCLKLEVTETVFIDDFEIVNDLLKQLARLKIKISIDDFGTGYSSLSYLQNLPAHTLKLDRAFVSDIERDKNRAIASAVISLGHLVGMDIIAEGIETSEQLSILKSLGAEFGQGYYFDRPLPAAEAESKLALHAAYRGN